MVMWILENDKLPGDFSRPVLIASNKRSDAKTTAVRKNLATALIAPVCPMITVMLPGIVMSSTLDLVGGDSSGYEKKQCTFDNVFLQARVTQFLVILGTFLPR